MIPAQASADPAFDDAAKGRVVALCEAIARTARVARLLIDEGRRVDLADLDRGVGLLCAKALDLPPELGRTLLPRLHALRDDLDLLTLALHTGVGAR